MKTIFSNSPLLTRSESHIRIKFRLLLLVTAQLFVMSAFGNTCSIDPVQFQAQALAALNRDYPNQSFRIGKNADVILMGDVELGLQNLRSQLCLATPALSDSEWKAAIHNHFQAMMTMLQQRKVELPREWASAKDSIRAQLFPQEYLKDLDDAHLVVFKPFVPGVVVGVAVNEDKGYAYVRREDQVRWEVPEATLFEIALDNLDRKSPNAKLQGSNSGDKFLAFEEKDGFDAVRILIPWVQHEAARLLGDPFYAAVPNRDFLIMWSTANSSGFQAFARQKIQQDSLSQPYPLTSAVLMVWSNGHIEVAQ